MALLYAITIFVSAFLLFLIQPLIAKHIQPWFGGTPSIWTTCILFFQILLLGGYAYAHLLIRKLKPRHQMLLHIVLLAAAVSMLPVSPSPEWKPDNPDHPIGRILLLLAASVGLPYFLLSATGPLLQQSLKRSTSLQTTTWSTWLAS